MQFFLALPFIVILFLKKRAWGYVATIGLILANLVITFTLSMAYHAGMTLLNDKGINSTYLYYKPWTRMGAYFVGTLFGLAYYEYKQQSNDSTDRFGAKIYNLVKGSKIVRVTAFVVGASLITFLVWAPLDEYRNVMT